MKLELVNFRCWKKKTFTFPDEGLVLLCGNSGSGKTSILSAIYFALYGNGTKIVSFGEKKCSVRFVYNGLDITRTKCPNRLVLVNNDGDYEDDVAQEIIVKKFGLNFTLTSYITQKSVQSFLNLGPIDKMNFLEQLAIGEDITGIKKKVKERIKERKEILQQKVGQLELLSSEIGEMKIPTEIPFPLGKTHSDVKIKNEKIFWKRTIKEISQKLEEKKTVEDQYNKEKVKIAVLDQKKTSLQELLQKKNKIEKEISSIDFDGEDNISELKTTLNFLKNKREFSSLSDRYNEEKNRYEKMYNEEINTMKEEKQKILNSLSTIDKDSFNEPKIKEIKDAIEIHNRISSLRKEILTHEENRKKYVDCNREEEINIKENDIETLRSRITSLQQCVDIKCCPNCKTSLRIVNKNLIVSSGNPVDEEESNNEIKKLKKEIESGKSIVDKLKREINDISYIDNKIKGYRVTLNGLEESDRLEMTLPELENDMILLKKKKMEYETLTEKLKIISKKIDNDELSPTLKSLKSGVQKKGLELQNIKTQLEEDFETDYTEEELREEISNQTLFSQKIKLLNNELHTVSQSYDKLLIQINEIKISDREFDDELSSLVDSIKDLKIKEEEHKYNDEKINKYLQYKKEEEEYKKWTDKLQKCKEEEESAKKELSYTDLFFRKIQEAESIAISQTIDNINYHMNYYLDKFFPDNPITVQILPYKETKKDIKPSINIVVGYKGIETDINSLSGGEYDRVSLSILLALNTMFGSNIIMLDESISSLDSEITGDIIEVLKESMKDKIIIIVSHQIPTGLFDGIVNVDE